jgi:regulatory protein
LAAKGLTGSEIEAALKADEGDDLARARELLERRGDPLVDERARARALAFLARRGYDSETAYDAVRAVERTSA